MDQFAPVFKQLPKSNRTIAYLPEQSFDQWFTARLPPDFREYYLLRLELTGSGISGAVCTKPTQVAGRDLPVNSVVIRKYLHADTFEKRAYYGMVIVHEVAHANGANEYQARIDERAYLRRRGLRGPTDLQLLTAVCRYSYYDFKDALEGVLGRKVGYFRTQYERIRYRCFSHEQYSLAQDIAEHRPKVLVDF
jgi:hypothetical protein